MGLGRSLRERIYVRLYHWLLKREPSRTLGSITVVDANLDPADDGPFFDAVEQAIAMIRQLDPRRLRRIESACRFIINTESTALAHFDPLLEACVIDFGRLRDRRQRYGKEWVAAKVAVHLVHEATHGYLAAQGIPYGRAERARVERLCVREEQRFVSRLPEGLRQLHPLAESFDERRWLATWYDDRASRLNAFSRRQKQSKYDAIIRRGEPWGGESG